MLSGRNLAVAIEDATAGPAWFPFICKEKALKLDGRFHGNAGEQFYRKMPVVPA